MKKNKQNILILVIVLLSSIMLIYCEFHKYGYHEDEVYSISSSVSEIWNTGLLYKTRGEKPPLWLTKDQVKDYVSFTSNSNIKDVYQNQVDDVHPPLFYLLTFFTSAILPNFTLHNIFILNLIFFGLINLMLVKIAKELKKENLIIPTLLFYDFSLALINTVTFQRMYTMLTFFGLAYLYYNLKLKNQDFQFKKGDYLGFILTTTCGFLTQYFFVIYALAIFIMMFIYLMKKKDYLRMRKYLIVHIIAALLGLLIFPSAINHILFGGRGVGSMANTGYLSRLSTFQRIIFDNLGWLPIIILILIIYNLIKNKEFNYALVAIPALIYFLIIVQIVPFLEIRYIMLIIPLVVLSIVWSLNSFLNIKWLCLIIVVLNLFTLFTKTPSFLYQGYKATSDVSKNYQEYPAVFITDNTFTYLKNIKEMLNYRESIVNNYNNDELKYIENDTHLNDKFVLRLEAYFDTDKILQEVEDLGYKKTKELLKDENSVIYLMESGE